MTPSEPELPPQQPKKKTTRLTTRPMLPSPIPCIGFDYRLPVKPRSATDMWNCWHGLGQCNSKPILGGIPELERHSKAWRKSHSVSERKMFSRWKTTMNLLSEERRLHGALIFVELDSMFNSVSSLMEILKERKKIRGRISSSLV